MCSFFVGCCLAAWGGRGACVLVGVLAWCPPLPSVTSMAETPQNHVPWRSAMITRRRLVELPRSSVLAVSFKSDTSGAAAAGGATATTADPSMREREGARGACPCGVEGQEK